MLLTELLSPERIKIPLESRGKDEVIEELVRILVRAGDVKDPGPVVEAVREREKVLSTGIGGGVAVPHAKCDGVADLVLAAGVAPEPVPFDALDGEPVRLFFLLLAPETAAGRHVKALGRISRLLRKRGLLDDLVEASGSRDFYERLRKAEGA